MALKVLMLRKRLTELEAALEKVRAAAVGFETREAELETDIEAAGTDEERAAVEAAVDEFEAEKAANTTEQDRLKNQIQTIEQEIQAFEAAAPDKPAAAAAEPAQRKDDNTMILTRTSQAPFAESASFRGFTVRDNIQHALLRARPTGDDDGQAHVPVVQRTEVKEFLERTRRMATETRAIKGSELLIPNVLLSILRDNIQHYSKLLKYTLHRTVKGTARQRIAGRIPEAVWTEMCAKLNELDLQFNAVETDGYKVGGFVVICNSTLEDSDISLATEIMDNLGQSIGYAKDKAICYGKGKKMPLGFITRLAQTAAPDDAPAYAPKWVDLHTTNLQKLADTLEGVKFFQAFILACANMSSKYSSGQKFWAMNEQTKAKFLSKALAFNAAGVIVAQSTNSMPILGGTIEELDFIPDGDILGGYGDLYLDVERAGTQLAVSEHVQFIEDNTIFKGTARADGLPVMPKGFIGINIMGQNVTTEVTFAHDGANETTPEPEPEGEGG